MAMFQKDVQGSLKPQVIISPGFDEHPFPEMSAGTENPFRSDDPR